MVHLHQHRLDALRLVDEGLGADLQPPDFGVGDAGFLDQPVQDCQAERVDILAVRAEPHPEHSKSFKGLGHTDRLAYTHIESLGDIKH